MEKGNKIKIFLAIAYTIILTLFLWTFFSKFSFSDLTSFDFIKNNRDYLIGIKEKNYLVISLLFFIFTIIWVILLGFGTPIFLIGGFIFGKWLGTFLVILGLTTGATILYIFANYFLKDFIEEKFSKRFALLHEKFKKNEFFYFLIYRFVGGIPFQISNILPVLFNIKFRNYFFGSLIGMFPQVFVWVSLGSGLEKIIDDNLEFPNFIDLIMTKEIYLPIIGFGILIFIGFIVKKFFATN